MKTLRSRGHRALLTILVDLRVQAGLTQRQLAERLNWPQPRVANVERGERRIDPVECAAWAKACGKTPQRLFLMFTRALELR